MEVHKEAIYFFWLETMTSICPLPLQSKHIRRVIKSTLAAETLAMVDLAEACIFLENSY